MTLSTDHIIWHSDTRNFSTEASKFPSILSLDKVHIKNPKTGNRVEFRKEGVDKSSAGELLAVKFVANHPNLDVSLIVFND